jgi:integrase
VADGRAVLGTSARSVPVALVHYEQVANALETRTPRSLSPERAAALARLLAELEARIAPLPLSELTAPDLRAFVDAKLAGGFHASTLRRQLKMLRAHFRRLCIAGEITGATYEAVHSVELPPHTTLSVPNPHSPEEIDGLWRLLDGRWPKLPPDKARHWIGRWRDGRSPYSRIRGHAIRCQLDAIVALGLHCGLRKSEILRLDERSMHPDNEAVVVWQTGEAWVGSFREVPYSDEARDLIAPWMTIRSVIAPGHDRAWLNLHARTTIREPMTDFTFGNLLATYVGAGWTFRRLRDTAAQRRVHERVPVLKVVERLGLAVGSVDRRFSVAPITDK